jgi:hypothetical protein
MTVAPLMLKTTVSIVFRADIVCTTLFQNLIGGYAPCLPMTVVLERPRLVTGHDITKLTLYCPSSTWSNCRPTSTRIYPSSPVGVWGAKRSETFSTAIFSTKCE